MLRRYQSDPNHVIMGQPIEVRDNLSYIEEPVQILDTKVKQLRNRKIPMVKVGWQNHSKEEATWETEEYMQTNYPYLFQPLSNFQKISRTKFFLFFLLLGQPTVWSEGR